MTHPAPRSTAETLLPCARLAALIVAALTFSISTASAQIARVGDSKPLLSAGLHIGNDVCYEPNHHVYLVVAAYGPAYGMFTNTAGDLVVPAFPMGTTNAGSSFSHYPSCEYSPDLNGGSGGFLVTWHMSGGVYSVVVAYPTGVVGPQRLISNLTAGGSNPGIRSAIAYSRTSRRFLVAWTTGDWATHGQFVDTSGVPIDGTGASIVNASTGVPTSVLPLAPAGGTRDPGVAWNPATNEFGLGYAGWTASNGYVAFSRVRATDGAVVGGGPFYLGGGTYQANVALNTANNRYVVAWTTGVTSLSAEFNSSGTMLGAARLVSTSVGTATSLDLSFNATSGTFLAVGENAQSVAAMGTELNGVGAPTMAAIPLTDGTPNGSFVPRATARTGVAQWNISYSRNLSVVSDQIVGTGTTGGGGDGGGGGGGGCSYTVSPSTIAAPRTGGGAVFTVTTTSSCAWTVTKSADWIALGDTGGSGTTTVYFATAANTQPQQRTTTLSVAGHTVSVIQSPALRTGVDFDGDGRGDILWQNYKNGGVGLWRMSGLWAVGSAMLGPGWIPDTGWKIVGASDFNLDGDTDVLWQHDNGHLSIWYMRGTTLLTGEVITQSPVPAGWRVVATGDLDGDNRPDILWQHTNGTLSVWYMEGASMRSGEIIVQPANAIWRVSAAADFNRDGWLDVIWRNSSTGQLAIWFLRNRQLIYAQLVDQAVADQDWQVVGITDFNLDGRPDLVWRHRWSGGVSGWLMNGTSVTAGYWLNPDKMDNDWVLAGPK